MTDRDNPAPDSTPRSFMGLPNTPVTRDIEMRVFGAFVQRLIAEMDEQPWWKKYSNTVMAIVSGLVVLAGWATTTGIDMPQWASVLIGVILFAGSVLGVRSTKNGITESVVEKVKSIQETVVTTPPPTGRHSSGD